MAKNQRIAIFFPRCNFFYISLYFSFKRSFEKHGCEVGGWPLLLDEPGMAAFLSAYKPDIILEMNRSRNQAPWLPESVIHIAWIVDLGSLTINDYQASDIIYFFNKRWLAIHNHHGSSLVKWLPPGYEPRDYRFARGVEDSNFSFAGHIPAPWTREELSREIQVGAQQTVTFRDFADKCSQAWANPLVPITPDQPCIAHSTLSSYCLDDWLARADHKLVYDINCRLGRLFGRRKLIDLGLSVSTSFELYGSPNWRLWPQYQHHYKGELYTPEELASLYQRTRINLHEGVSLHMRLFDCMAAGGFMLYLTQQGFDFSHNPIHQFFESGTHYIATDAADFRACAHHFLDNSEARRTIATQAAELVHNEHTWEHRVSDILSDIQLIRRL